MPYQIQVGSQVVEFPDSVGQDEAQRILSEQFPATGEDIAGAMQDPAYKPSVDDYLKYEEYSKNKQTDWVNTIAQSVDAAAGMIGGAISQGAQGAVANPLNYIEGAAQGTRQLYGLVAQSQDPASPLFKFKDLVAGTGTPESRYNQFLEARDFANTTARLERGEEGLFVPPELTNPEFVQGVSMILDPTLALPGIGEVFGAGKLATRAVGKGTQLAGRAITGAARPLERVAGAAERMTAEALGMAPEALRNTAATAGIAGALGIAPEAAAFAAIPAGIRTAREAGEALARAGENLMTQPSRIGPLEAIGAAPGANLRQRMLGVVGQYGGDAALDASLRGIAGGIEGAAIGTGLGYLSGGEEGAAAGLGSGGVQGAAGALGGRMYQKLTGAAAKEARAGDLGRFIDAQQDPTTKTLFERVRDQHGVDAASALMDLQGLVRGKFGDVDILYRSNAQMAEKFGDNIRGVQFEQAERPTIFINADIIGKGTGDGPLYTLGHELFHALEKTTQLEGGATEIKDALVGRWVQEGDITRKLAEGAFNDAEIEARFNEYRDKLAAGSPERADQLAQYDTIDKKAGYVASELAAEHFAGLLAGQKPDALLKGFTGITRQLLDSALTQNASRALADAAATIERTFGVKPTDSVLFPDLKQASPQVNAMLRDLVRARRKLDERITMENEGPAKVLKPQDVSNPIAAKQLVDLGVAEKMPDGSVRNLSDEEIRVREEKDTAAIRTILEGVPGARVVDGEILGRFSPQQLSAIEQSQAVSSRMKDKIRAVNAAMDAGNSLFLNYGAATRRVKNRLTGKFTSKYNSGIRISQREVLPYSFYLSKADNPVIKAIDISKIRGALDKLTAPDGGVAAGLWDNVDGFMSDLAAYFTNLDAGEGARRSAEIFGLEKAKFLGDFVNEQEKGGRKFVRDFRLDRIGSTAPMDFRARISEDAIQKSKMRWMPAETIGDKSVINSEEGYRIISGAKHKLYGPDGKLIGIYDTQTQAERKADATQARLQPEVRQQQYPARDEVRKTAEAGGRNRNVGGTQGREEGRQELGSVRQAGDVRFMPDGKSAGLAVLDNELALNLPKRPKVLDIANAFQDLFGKAIEYRKSNPQDNAKLVKSLAQEIQRAVDLHPEAKGWYDENIKLTMDVMRDLDPDLAKPENDFMFKVILAATSDGNKVGPQFQQTWKEYSNWKNTGKISGDFVSGDRIENIKGNLKMFNEMVNAIGWEKTKDFFTRKGTVKEVRQALMDTFGWTKKEAQGIGSSELTDEVVPFAVVLGPKLGSFFNNLYGDFSSVTMDRWFMRTIGRLTGTQVEPLAGAKVRDMRNNLRDAVSRLTPSQFELLGIKRGDLKGTSIDDAATTISGRFAKKSLRDTAKQFAESGESALEETRKFANALKKGLNPLVEAPVDGTHRRWIRERIAEVQKDLRSSGIELENADLQAVLWYLEKELYEKLNYRSKSGESDYASAASSLYQSVAGRPSDVYARGTGRVRAIGGDGRGNVLDTANGGQAPRQEVGAQRFMPDVDRNLVALHNTTEEGIRSALKLGGIPVPSLGITKKDKAFTGFGDITLIADKATVDPQSDPRNRMYNADVYSPRQPRPFQAVKRGAKDALSKRMLSLLPKGFQNWNDIAPGERAYDRVVEKGENNVVETTRKLTGSADVQAAFLTQNGVQVPRLMKDPNLRNRVLEKEQLSDPRLAVLSQHSRDLYDFLQTPDGLAVSDVLRDLAYKERGGTVGDLNNDQKQRLNDLLEKSYGARGTPFPFRYADDIVGDLDIVAKNQKEVDRYGIQEWIREQIKPRETEFKNWVEGLVADTFEPDKKLIRGSKKLPYTLENVTDAMTGKVRGQEEGGLTHSLGRARSESAVQFRDLEQARAAESSLMTREELKPLRQERQNQFDQVVEALAPFDKYQNRNAFDRLDNLSEAMGKIAKRPASATSVLASFDYTGISPQVLSDVKKFALSLRNDPTEYFEAKPQRAVGLNEFKAAIVPESTSQDVVDALRSSGLYVEKYTDNANRIATVERVSGDQGLRFMPSADSSMPGAYTFTGGYRALPGKAKGSLRLYGPAGSLIGIASSLDEAQRILRRKAK
jgi:hypothetical protein